MSTANDLSERDVCTWTHHRPWPAITFGKAERVEANVTTTQADQRRLLNALLHGALADAAWRRL